jgi:hypothetical protein
MKSLTDRHIAPAQLHNILSLCLLMAALLPLLTSFQKRGPRLDEMYDTFIIVDAEAADYDEFEFEQIDHEEFIDIINRARLAYIAFEPAWQVNLFDDYGIRYSVYISKSCRYLRIDSNYFKLKRSASKRLQYLLVMSR